jgi:polyphosphate kinase 2 (PPK2 family)
MKIHLKDYRIGPGEDVDLGKRKTLVKPVYTSKAHYQEILTTHVGKLSDLQQRHEAANAHALLVIFQAMDAAGKDGAIRHVMSGVNPQGCQVYSFKTPSTLEREHDFLWRAALRLPERGRSASSTDPITRKC